MASSDNGLLRPAARAVTHGGHRDSDATAKVTPGPRVLANWLAVIRVGSRHPQGRPLPSPRRQPLYARASTDRGWEISHLPLSTALRSAGLARQAVRG
jgi:hypothetical protein